MAIRPILEVPDPRLRVISEPVTVFGPDLRALVQDMFDTMYAAPGIGLAAIQVGEPLRLLVMDLGDGAVPDPADGEDPVPEDAPERRNPHVFVNPEILAESEEVSVYKEGCLSLPEQFAEVDRPARCRARWQDLEGSVHEAEMEGLLATCLQHEMDHLDGILFIDHLSRLKRDMILKRLTKLRRAA